MKAMGLPTLRGGHELLAISDFRGIQRWETHVALGIARWHRATQQARMRAGAHQGTSPAGAERGARPILGQVQGKISRGTPSFGWSISAPPSLEPPRQDRQGEPTPATWSDAKKPLCDSWRNDTRSTTRLRRRWFGPPAQMSPNGTNSHQVSCGSAICAKPWRAWTFGLSRRAPRIRHDSEVPVERGRFRSTGTPT